MVRPLATAVAEYWVTTQGKFYLLLLTVGLCATVFLTYEMARSGIHISGALINVTSGFLVAALGAVSLKLVETWDDNCERPDFALFFGDQALEDDYKVLFSHLVLKQDEAGRSIIDVPFPPPGAKGTLPKRIGHVVALDELNVLIGLDRLFHRFGGRLDIDLEHSHATETGKLLEKECLAIGLGYNNATWLLCQLSNGLFSPFYADGTDDFKLCDEKNQPVDPQKLCRLEKNQEYAVVARILVQRKHRLVPYFICAGHTAPGTVVACQFLADNWAKMLSWYKDVGKNPSLHHMAALLFHPEMHVEGGYVRQVCFRPAIDGTNIKTFCSDVKPNT